MRILLIFQQHINIYKSAHKDHQQSCFFLQSSMIANSSIAGLCVCSVYMNLNYKIMKQLKYEYLIDTIRFPCDYFLSPIASHKKIDN